MRATFRYIVLLAVLGLMACGQPGRDYHNYVARVTTILSSANPIYTGGNSIAAAADGSVFAINTGKSNILKISPSGDVSVFAGSPTGASGNSSSLLSDVFGIAVDDDGYVYVSEFSYHDIRKISPSGQISTLAGNWGVSGDDDLQGTSATFDNPTGLAVDSQHRVYVADFQNSTIRRITPDGFVTTIAGDKIGHTAASVNGPGVDAEFNNPTGVALDSAGNVYVADHQGNYVRKIANDAQFTVSTVAGNGTPAWADGPALQAMFNSPSGVAVGDDGRIYVGGWQDQTVRQITPSGLVTTIAGRYGDQSLVDGPGPEARFVGPYGLSFRNGVLYVADGGGKAVRKIIPGAPYPH